MNVGTSGLKDLRKKNKHKINYYIATFSVKTIQPNFFSLTMNTVVGTLCNTKY